MNPETQQARIEHLQKALPEGGLFEAKSWKPSPVAFPLGESFAQELEKLGHRLALFQKACNELYHQSADGRQPEWIAELLDRGKPPELIALASEKRLRLSVPKIIRPDLLLTESGYVISELDSVPGGIGLTDWLNYQYSNLGEEPIGGADGMMEGFRSILSDGGIFVSEEAATYRPEMEWLVRRIAAKSGNGPEVFDCRERTDYPANAYRFFELFDLANLPLWPSLEEKIRRGEVQLTPPPKPALEEKLWFALFWLRPLHAFWRRELGDRAMTALQEVIPYTWLLNPEPLPPHAVLPRLEAQSWEELENYSQNQRQLVVKISGFSENAWGSRGVVIGHDVSKTDWIDSLRSALAAWPTAPHILQAFHPARVVEHPIFQEEKGAVEITRGRVRLCPYFFVPEKKAQCGGVLTTIVPADKKIIHGMRDACLVPARF